MRKLLGIVLGVVLALAVGTGGVAAAPPTTGSGSLDFGPSLVPAERDGVEGRIVYLTGAIRGENFEPGDCNPFRSGDLPPELQFLVGKCVNFTKSEPVRPGEFKRARRGQTAFTVCDPCTLTDPETGEERTGSFTLKISYPNPNNLTFTKFTIQDAAGGLEGLRGQGTLDFTTGTYTIRYHFTGRPTR